MSVAKNAPYSTIVRRVRRRCGKHIAVTVSMTVAVAVAVGCHPVTRRGLQPLVTDRPDFTESTETVQRGMLQLESGATFTRLPTTRTGSLGEMLLRIGTTRATELRVGINSFSLAQADGVVSGGLEDVSLGAKLKLRDGGGRGSLLPAIAVIIGTSLPTGGVRYRARAPQPQAKLGAAWELTTRSILSSNLNYTRISSEAGTYGEIAGSTSLSVKLTGRVWTFGEYYAFVPRNSLYTRTQFIDGGVTYGITDNLQADVRGGVRVYDVPVRHYFLGIGVSRRW